MSFLNEQPMDEFGNYICDGCGEPVIPAHGDELSVDRSQWGHGDGPATGEATEPHDMCARGAGRWLIWQL